MKKLTILFLLLLFPCQVLAYSNYIIPGGDTLGININTKGILVVGFYQINGEYNKGKPELKAGDAIIKINDTPISSIKELTNNIEKHVSQKAVTITFLRNNKEKTTVLPLIEDDGLFKTGLYVKDNITGIGTLTYVDPETHIYGALGHEIIEATTSKIVEIKDGSIFRNVITSIDKSSEGNAGSKNAKFYYNTVYGDIKKNTKYGIYGEYTNTIPAKNALEVAQPEEVKIGEATIYTVLKDESIKDYKIEITAINENSDVKNISFTLNDEELISQTGGIVQGMSGSPIIQNGKIIGAVTHVIIDNPLTGYGIFITTMLEEGEK